VGGIREDTEKRMPLLSRYNIRLGAHEAKLVLVRRVSKISSLPAHINNAPQVVVLLAFYPEDIAFLMA
jgi:hypothetical protein